MRWPVLLATFAAIACSTGVRSGSPGVPDPASTPFVAPPGAAAAPLPAPASLDARLEAIRAEHGVPALAAAVTRVSGEVARGAAGVRRLGHPAHVATTDPFHIGSVTKPFTGTLAGLLVAGGRLRWDTRLADVLPGGGPPARPEYADVTLADLLSHEAGIRPFTEDTELGGLTFEGSPSEQRLAFVRHALTLEPAAARGTFHYSNAGFAAAAVMLETVTGEPWEEQVRARILTPLGLATARLGWPAKALAEAPWGHLEEGGALTPHDPHGEYQLPAIFAASGDLAMSMPDLASFLREHLRALRGEPAILPAAIAREMHTRRARGGLGFGVGKVREIEPASTYSGSAGTFLCMVVVAPRHDVAVAVAANASHAPAEAALKQALVELLTTYATPPAEAPPL